MKDDMINAWLVTELKLVITVSRRGSTTLPRVISTCLKLDNIYCEAKLMLHMIHCRGLSNSFTHAWDLTCSARSRYQLYARVHVYVNL